MSGGLALLRDIGAYIKAVIGVDPADAGDGTVNGAAIDRLGFDSCVLHTSGGVASGGPTTQLIDAKLQDSILAAGPWGDITGAAIAQLSADSTEAQVDVDLSGQKQFIRVVHTVTFTGGASPAWPSASNVILGGASEIPA